VREWLKGEKLWTEGEQYIIVPKVPGTNCPELIQIDLARDGSGRLEGTMFAGDRHSRADVMAWLRNFL
jgi:hypothetical protein